MPTGATIEERAKEYFDYDDLVVVTSQESKDDRREEIEQAKQNADDNTDLVWFEWQESHSHLDEDEVASGNVSITVNAKFHPIGEDLHLHHHVLIPREQAEEHGHACVNFPDVPDPKPADEVTEAPDFDLDEDPDPDIDLDIPTTEEEIERSEQTREQTTEHLIDELGIDENSIRLFDLTRVHGVEDVAFFAFSIETEAGDAYRGKVYLEDDEDPTSPSRVETHFATDA